MKPVLEILGRLLSDSSFRAAFMNNYESALSSSGYVLTAAETAIAANIATSAGEGALNVAFEQVAAQCPNWPCGRMRQALWQIFGGMMVDGEFRDALLAARVSRLSRDGYVLTPDHDAVLVQIVVSFSSGALNGAVAAVAASCPNWPCGDPLMKP
jgi:hypothetical protein